LAIEKLEFLIGTWIGKGTAIFPTIKTTEYFEELKFISDKDDSVIFYELKSWINNKGNKGSVLSWQAGYINELEDGSFEMNNAQNNGRVEVLKGCLKEKEYYPNHLSFESKMFGNDERMVRTSRDFYVNGDEMRYTMFMATQKTPEFQKHLEGELIKHVDI
jgi:hypothetical protein